MSLASKKYPAFPRRGATDKDPVNWVPLVPEGNRDRQYHQSIESGDRDRRSCPFN
ncbi:hypothetical protein [Microcoleus sp. CAWBG556]|uniref:hypothetical protein n=1 Tax=Microcoleus sp. CAWBG556 TaxID=2841650 RepID=UPI0025DD50AD|nr:hypothetical protein [Microcoleus sp. CAWBG556]